ncbi:MAG: uroporphyrinogen-III synthase [Calditerrivibrio sp.]|nr:uroporphyrinogen-III synthase [Calditerrivibrio sp.]MCA1931977.1 uroporphyrinogen-III synthase [Calditerrivibrio sp.]MCA1980785.1 uroporphyrinogen-III synthase [Calditerrivibrio sp.]
MPGRKILITRQPEQSIEFINNLSFNRLYPFILPMIKTIPVKFDISDSYYDYVIVTSANTSEFLRPYIDKLKYNRAIAVGKKTKHAMDFVGFRSVEIPETFSQKGLIKYLSNEPIAGKKFFLPGAEERPDELNKFIMDNGGIVDSPSVYSTEKICYDDGYIVEFINEIGFDAVTFLSPSAAKGFFSQISFSDIKKVPLFVSIGPTTHDYLISIGIDNIYPKTNFTVDGIVELLVDIYKR